MVFAVQSTWGGMECGKSLRVVLPWRGSGARLLARCDVRYFMCAHRSGTPASQNHVGHLARRVCRVPQVTTPVVATFPELSPYNKAGNRKPEFVNSKSFRTPTHRGITQDSAEHGPCGRGIARSRQVCSSSDLPVAAAPIRHARGRQPSNLAQAASLLAAGERSNRSRAWASQTSEPVLRSCLSCLRRERALSASAALAR